MGSNGIQEGQQLPDEGVMGACPPCVLRSTRSRAFPPRLDPHEVQDLMANAFIHIAEALLIQNPEIVSNTTAFAQGTALSQSML